MILAALAEDKIDIAIDLAGYTTDALHPPSRVVPVQATYLAIPTAQPALAWASASWMGSLTAGASRFVHRDACAAWTRGASWVLPPDARPGMDPIASRGGPPGAHPARLNNPRQAQTDPGPLGQGPQARSWLAATSSHYLGDEGVRSVMRDEFAGAGIEPSRLDPSAPSPSVPTTQALTRGWTSPWIPFPTTAPRPRARPLLMGVPVVSSPAFARGRVGGLSAHGGRTSRPDRSRRSWVCAPRRGLKVGTQGVRRPPLDSALTSSDPSCAMGPASPVASRRPCARAGSGGRAAGWPRRGRGESLRSAN